MMFYIIYKITNNINNKIYIGAHQTTDLNDGYMGSGKCLLLAQKKYGLENFSKQILHVFDNAQDMYNMEAQLVNQKFISESTNYNIKLGGYGGWDHQKNKVVVKDSQGVIMCVSKYDPRYLNGELVYMWLGKNHTPETRKLIGEITRVHQSGMGNSQYGTVWIYSLTQKINKKIKKHELDLYLEKGWIKGRKIKFD